MTALTDASGRSENDYMNTPMMRGVKVALAVVGIIILAGFAFIAYEVVRRAVDPQYAAQVRSDGGAAAALRSVASGAVGQPVPAPGPGALMLPPGSRMVETVAVGSRLAVTVRGPDGGEALYLVCTSRPEVQQVIAVPPP